MDDLDKLIVEIIDFLNNELPYELINYKNEFEELVNRNLIRASYKVLDDLCKEKKWKPPVKLLGLLDRYKIVF